MTTATLELLITSLPGIKSQHNTKTDIYTLLKQMAKKEISELFSDSSNKEKHFAPFGQIIFPYYQMGAVDSLDLFGLDELILFSFYWINRHRYRRVLDIGGNIGLHSILMSKCGYDVRVFEPDHHHFEKLMQNLSLNKIENVTPVCAAVSTETGTAQFVRTLGNTTSSHLKGSKNPYGELETFSVPIHNIKQILQGIDLMKMDVEGHEKEILLAMDDADWKSLDGVVEIGSEENAKAVFDHLQNIQVNAFSQKKGWEKVTSLQDMPTSHREGSLFISCKEEMPWDVV